MFLLDTNVVSELRRPERADPHVVAWAASHPAADFFLSVIKKMEKWKTIGHRVDGDLQTVVDAIRRLRTIRSLHLFSTRQGQPYTKPYTGDGFRSIGQRYMTKALKEGRLAERALRNTISARRAERTRMALDLAPKNSWDTNSRRTTRRYIRHKQALKVTSLTKKY